MKIIYSRMNRIRAYYHSRPDAFTLNTSLIYWVATEEARLTSSME